MAEKTNALAALAGLELEPDRAGRLTLLHPGTQMPLTDKSGKEAYIDLLSSDSEVAEKHRKEIRTARMRTRNPNKIDLDAESNELLARLTTGWYLVDFTGNPIDVPFTRENALAIYGNHKMAWLTDQADSFAGERANFLQASSTS